MTHQRIIDHCLEKPCTYLDYPFEADYTVVKVKSPSQEKGRIFAQVFILRGEPKVTLNCSPDIANFYRNVYPGSVVRGWHCPPVQQPHFNTISLDGAVPDEEILHMIDLAFDIVVSKMPKYVQKELAEKSL